MRRAIAVLAAMAVVAGCGKQPPVSSAPPPVAPSASQPSSAPPTPRTAPQPAHANPAPTSGGNVVAGPSAPASTSSVGEIFTAPVTVMIEKKRQIALIDARSLVQTYEAMNGELPKTLEDAAKALNVRCPVPPDGWMWKYDPQSGQLDIVKE